MPHLQIVLDAELVVPLSSKGAHPKPPRPSLKVETKCEGARTSRLRHTATTDAAVTVKLKVVERAGGNPRVAERVLASEVMNWEEQIEGTKWWQAGVRELDQLCAGS